jgi:hypothetical protein
MDKNLWDEECEYHNTVVTENFVTENFGAENLGTEDLGTENFGIENFGIENFGIENFGNKNCSYVSQNKKTAQQSPKSHINKCLSFCDKAQKYVDNLGHGLHFNLPECHTKCNYQNSILNAITKNTNHKN